MSPYFELPDKPVQLSAKIPSSTKRLLEVVRRIWQIQARARGADEKTVAGIDMTHVVQRLLKIGGEGALGEVLERAKLRHLPQSDADWDAIEAAIRAEGTSSSK